MNRVFERVLLIAPPGAKKDLLNFLPKPKRPKSILSAWFAIGERAVDVVLDDEAIPFDPESFDLVISLLSLHSANDLPGALIQTKRILKPDGLFMGALFGGDTLSGFRQALYQTDQELLGGITARVAPFSDYQQLAGLLQRAGFAQPVVDRDRVNVSYKKLSDLLRDLRDMGETNILTARQRKILPKLYASHLENTLMQSNDIDDGRFTDCFEILWMTGWSPHHSQQQPLKPGSAQISLKDVIGKIRTI